VLGEQSDHGGPARAIHGIHKTPFGLAEVEYADHLFGASQLVSGAVVLLELRDPGADGIKYRVRAEVRLQSFKLSDPSCDRPAQNDRYGGAGSASPLTLPTGPTHLLAEPTKSRDPGT